MASPSEGTFIVASVGTSLLNHLVTELGSTGFPEVRQAISYPINQKPTDLFQKQNDYSCGVGGRSHTVQWMRSKPLNETVHKAGENPCL